MPIMTSRRSAQALGLIPAFLALGACAGMESRSAAQTPSPPTLATPAPATIAAYLDTLANMAPGDPIRQQAELAAALESARQSPTAANRLRYALALGAAGHKDSNPVEAKRLLADLLAGPNDLGTQELELANAYLREFDARVALYAELARQREESQQKLKLNDSSATKRADALAAENARLKKQLAEANRKLEAVAEMERSLQEQAQDQAPETEPEAQPPKP
jgi:flagellar biosynthesis GTPase FlhF